MESRARTPIVSLVGLLALALPAAGADRPTVYLGGGLSAENVVVLGAALAAADPDAVLLLDGPPGLKPALASLDPRRIVPVGVFGGSVGDLAERLGRRVERPRVWSGGPPRTLWRELFPKAAQVVVCPATPRSQLLQAACLAGVLKAPLYVLHGRTADTRELHQYLRDWKTERVYAVGKAYPPPSQLAGIRITRLADEPAVSTAYLRRLEAHGPIETLVVANPSDADGGAALSSLAPWLALQRQAGLLLTGEAGTDVDDRVEKATQARRLRKVETLLLVADLKAIPVHQRPNPIPRDKDPLIDLEPLTPSGNEPFSYAVGRVFHKDAARTLLVLARQRLLADRSALRALVASNPGNSLPLLETFSRATAHEFRNLGLELTTYFGAEVDPARIRRALPHHDLFLWEGHHNTLVREWKFCEWDEPLPSSFVFLQSCLALMEEKVQPLLDRGAVAVVGTSTRTYSASGGAFSLAYFDAILHEQRTLGEALRQAKNFMQAYIQLKEKRLGQDARRTGANRRAAWAFTLWGDPTLRLPPVAKTPDKPPVRHEVKGSTLTLTLPDEKHDRIRSEAYRADLSANARLAGLVRGPKGEEVRPLVPLVFAEVSLPRAPDGKVPRLSSRLPQDHYVFNWDARRRCGYLLALPRSRDREELRFQVRWVAPAELAAAGGE